MQLNAMIISLLPLLSFAPVVQAESTVERVPPECYNCFNEWRSYKHDRDLFVVGACEEGLSIPPESGRVVKLLMENWKIRYPSIPASLTELSISENPDCKQITKPVQQWVYDHHMASCLPQVPASCHQRFPRP
jgi:hypothetical protein